MPAQKNQITLQPPVGGMNRRIGFQKQPPFESYESINFWPTDPLTGRSVTGTRPAIVAFASPGNNVNMLTRVNGAVSGKPLQSLVAANNGSVYWLNSSNTWTVATGAGATSMETNIPLFATTFLQQTIIPQFDDKPWIFDYSAGTVTELVESAGTVPDDLRIFEVWQGALWAAGRIDAPNILYASRVGDVTDWDFAAVATDTGGAFFTAGEDEGLLRGPITAIMPQTSDTMIVSTTEGLVAMRAHPRAGGVFEDIGGTWVLGQGAWAKGPNDSLYFLTRLGLYMLPPNPGAVPTPVSPTKIPDELIGLEYDFSDPTIEIAYDSRFNGLWITDRQSGSEQAWFFDMAAGGFHKITLSGYPYRLEEYFPQVTTNTSGLLLAGTSYGGIGQPDRVGAETFDASLTIGPFALSNSPVRATKIVQAKFIFGGDTPTVDGTVKFSVGASAEDTITRLEDDNEQYSVTLNTLVNNQCVCYPHVSGHAGAIEITQTGGRVTIEEIALTLVTAGVSRIVKYKTPTICQGYATATPQSAPSTGAIAETDAMEYIDLSNLPSEWWALVNSTGSNVRVTDASNVFIPFDVVTIDTTAETGNIRLRRALPATPVAVRCWVCNQNLAKFPPGSEFGQAFAYPPWIIGIWPGEQGPNRLPSLAWPEYDFDSTPSGGDISGAPPSAGAGEPDECPTADTLHYVSLVQTITAYDDETIPAVNENYLLSGEGDITQPVGENVLTIHAATGLEFTNICSSGAEEEGDSGNQSMVVILWNPVAGAMPDQTDIHLIGRTTGGSYSMVAQVQNFGDSVDPTEDVQLLRVKCEGGINAYEVWWNESQAIDTTFGSGGANPTWVSWRRTTPNQDADTVHQTFFDSASGLQSGDVTNLSRSIVHERFVTDTWTEEQRDAVNHLKSQLNANEDYWGDWFWQGAADTNLDVANFNPI